MGMTKPLHRRIGWGQALLQRTYIKYSVPEPDLCLLGEQGFYP